MSAFRTGLVAAVAGIATAHAVAATPIENVSQQWAGYWNAKNLAAIMTLYAPEPTFLPTSGERWGGAASIRRHFAAGMKQYDPRLTMQSVASGTSANLAYDSGSYDEILAPAKGGKQIHVKGSYLFLFQKQKRGGWKILEQSWTEFDPAKL
jgi:uncharacterized protein (TIGR02246 family)